MLQPARAFLKSFVKSHPLLLAGLFVLLVLAASLVKRGLRQGYEHARYQVVEQRAAFEVREYEPRIVAEVTVSTQDGSLASKQGFRILADYIFGNNLSAQSVAMTSPVDVQGDGQAEKIAMTTPVDRGGDAGAWTVRFTMPRALQLDQLPTPRDRRVRLVQRPATRFAVARFAGRPNERTVQLQTTSLATAIHAAGLTRSQARPTYSQYDPPWVPGFMRRNEVALELAHGDVVALETFNTL